MAKRKPNKSRANIKGNVIGRAHSQLKSAFSSLLFFLLPPPHFLTPPLHLYNSLASTDSLALQILMLNLMKSSRLNHWARLTPGIISSKSMELHEGWAGTSDVFWVFWHPASELCNSRLMIYTVQGFLNTAETKEKIWVPWKVFIIAVALHLSYIRTAPMFPAQDS